MPNRDDHLAQAVHNRAFYDSINRELYTDWAIIVIFYAALHYIDAFLATVPYPPIHPGRHDVRDNSVRDLAQLRPIYSEYRTLKDQSRTARYYPPSHFTQNHLETSLLFLERIRTALRPYVPGI